MKLNLEITALRKITALWKLRKSRREKSGIIKESQSPRQTFLYYYLNSGALYTTLPSAFWILYAVLE